MRSKNADFLKAGLIEQARRLKPAQRVRAFIEHRRIWKTPKGFFACKRAVSIWI